MAEFRRDWTLGAGVLALTAAVLAGVDAGIYALVRPAPDLAARFAEYLVDPRWFRPEPAERTSYVVDCLLAPFLIAGFYELLRRAWDAGRPAEAARRALHAASFAALATLAITSTRGDHGVFVDGTLLSGHLLAAAAAWAALYAWLRRERGAAALAPLLGAGLAALVAYGVFCRLVGGLDAYVFRRHFEALFSSVVQTRAGNPPLTAGNPPQYGLYAVMLDPLFRLIGLGVFRFSAVMGLLAALSRAAFFFFLARSLRRGWLAPLTVAAAIFVSDFHFAADLARRGLDAHYDPYFQYVPLRLLFPCLALAFSADRSERRRPLWTAVLALGCFWNLDSGVPALLAWLLALSCDAAARRNARVRREIAGLWLSAATALGAWAAALTLMLRIRSDAWPDWSLLTAPQRQFYGLGFFMLPMPPLHTWNLVILLYAAGLLLAWKDAREGLWDLRSRAVLLCSLLGLGVFSYYQGRSHDANLPSAAWPAFGMIALFLDRLLDAADGRDRISVPRAAAAFGVLVLAAFAGRGLGEFALFDRSVRARVFERAPAYPGLDADESFLHARLRPGETAAFLSDAEPVYHLAAGTRALPGPDIGELYRVEDVARLFGTILASPRLRVFSDRRTLEPGAANERQELNEALKRFLSAHYRIEAVSPSGRLVSFAKVGP